jgi:membrane protease YdiL (CAAX protease family)
MVLNNRKYFLAGVVLLPALILLMAKFYAKSYLLQFSLHHITVTQLLLLILISPIVEEIVFRGLAQDFLLKIIKNKYISFTLVNLTFTLFHLHKHLGFIYLLFVFSCGIILSIVKYQFKYLTYPISLHLYYNLLFVVFTLGD